MWEEILGRKHRLDTTKIRDTNWILGQTVHFTMAKEGRMFCAAVSQSPTVLIDISTGELEGARLVNLAG